MNRSQWSYRSLHRNTHPDDVLRRLARSKGPAIGPVVQAGFRRPPDGRRAFALGVLGVLAFVGVLVWLPVLIGRPHIAVRGIADGGAVGVTGVERFMIEIDAGNARDRQSAVVRFDGEVIEVDRKGEKLTWRAKPTDLTPGDHRLSITSGRRVLWRGPSRRTVRFSVDLEKPVLRVTLPEPVAVDRPLVVSGIVEARSRVLVGGVPAVVTGDRFRVELPTPPVGMITVRATDRAGNITVRRARSGADLPDLRTVHVSAAAWATPSLRDPVLEMAEKGQINAIQLDLKDESGKIGHSSAVPLANEIGATQGLYDLKAAVADIHSRGLRVVGRVVVFRDPVLGKYALASNQPGLVVQGVDGKPLKGKYGVGAFTNPAHALVRSYNLDVAREAADAGVDDILFDYIRRPEGSLDNLVFPGAKGPIEDDIISFLRATSRRLEGTKTRVGVSVFGIAARNPEQIGQPVRRMAAVVDYIAPMVYPSHWSKGYYDVDNPNAQPYDIVKRSLEDFLRQVEGTGAKVVPWLQDFSLGVTYGPEEVRAQIEATCDAGINGFLMWDPRVTYSSSGIPETNCSAN